MTFLMLGFDGMDYDLIVKNREHMPFISKLLSNSVWGPLYSFHQDTGLSWNSIYTGGWATRHGMKGFGFHLKYKKWFEAEMPYFWTWFNRHGLSVAVYNLPVIYPPKPISGWMVCGYPTPNPDEFTITYPKQLQKLIPDHEPGLAFRIFRIGNKKIKAAEIREVNTRLIDDFQVLWENQKTDMVAMQYRFIDDVGHTCLFYGTVSVKEVYQIADEMAKRIFEIVKPSKWMILSDHGHSLPEPYTPEICFNRPRLYGHTRQGILIMGPMKSQHFATKMIPCEPHYHAPRGERQFPGEIDPFPTICWMLDLPLPTGLDGQPFRPIGKLSPKEEEQIKNRLKALGYL